MSRSISWLTLVLVFFTPICVAETGTVAFYSAKLSAMDQVKLAVTVVGKTAAFAGWLFDGDQRIAHAEPGRFMTFHVPSGLHTFSASYNAKKPESATVTIDVEANHLYCVRLSSKYINYLVIPVSDVNGVINQVGCQRALKEAAASKPLKSKRVDASARGELDASTSFPKEE